MCWWICDIVSSNNLFETSMSLLDYWKCDHVHIDLLNFAINTISDPKYITNQYLLLR
jgi:hypothetical protein